MPSYSLHGFALRPIASGATAEDQRDILELLEARSITDFAHHAETVLSRVRDRDVRCLGGYADLAPRSRDMTRALLDAVEDARDGGAEGIPADYDRLLAIVCDPESADVSEAPLVPGALGGSASPRVAAIGACAGRDPLEDGGAGDPASPTPDRATARHGGDRVAGSTVRVRNTALGRLIEMVAEQVGDGRERLLLDIDRVRSATEVRSIASADA